MPDSTLWEVLVYLPHRDVDDDEVMAFLERLEPYFRGFFPKAHTDVLMLSVEHASLRGALDVALNAVESVTGTTVTAIAARSQREAEIHREQLLNASACTGRRDTGPARRARRTPRDRPRP